MQKVWLTQKIDERSRSSMATIRTFPDSLN